MFSTVLQNYQAIVDDYRNPTRVSPVVLVTAVVSTLQTTLTSNGQLAPGGITSLLSGSDGIQIYTVWPDNNVHVEYHERMDYSHTLYIHFPKTVIPNVDQYEYSALTEALDLYRDDLERAVRYYLNIPAGYRVAVVPNQLPVLTLSLFAIEISSVNEVESD